MTNLEYLLEKYKGKKLPINSETELCLVAYYCENPDNPDCGALACSECKFNNMYKCLEVINAPHCYEISPQDLTMLSLLSKLNLRYLVRNKLSRYLIAFEYKPNRNINGDWYENSGDVVCLDGFSKSFQFIKPEDEPFEVYKIIKDSKVI